MKHRLSAIPLTALLLLGAGCQKRETPPLSLPPAVQELQTQAVPESPKQETRTPVAIPTPTQVPTTLYMGSWFDIRYPQEFTVSPALPASNKNGEKTIQTDEATFTSPEGTVAFFVYSPLWSGNPKEYLTIAASEELVDEKTDEKTANGPSGGTKTRWVTLKAKDGSYYRSFVSIRRQLGSGSELHHVFGIKYRDMAAYETHKAAYAAFKQSLRQYAD